MPFFRVELEREVSRLVELRQTTSVLIEAPDLMSANDAARALARDEDELDQYATGWSDDDPSRVASNDEARRLPKVKRVAPSAMILGGPVYDAMSAA